MSTMIEHLEPRRLLASLPAGFAETQIATGLASPTAMELAPDGRIFVAEQGGKLRVIKNGALLGTEFLSVPTTSTGERGLLGVALDPNFASNRYVYVYYTATTPATHNRLSRFVANGDVVTPGSETILLELDNLSSATNHNGGAIHFGPDGKLYVAVGDNATGSNAQTLSNLHGKMLRLNADGSIPTDNPFYTTTTGKNRAIWSLGLRNPFTFTFQPGTGRMFINDVGQNTWEEINEGVKGANYNWPGTEGNFTVPNPNPNNLRAPFYTYNHSTGLAITGGAFYNPTINSFPSDYAGDYFFADYVSSWIKRIDLNTKTVTNFATGAGNPVDLRVGNDGSLYYLQRANGRLYKVNYTASQGPTIVTPPANQTVATGQTATFSVVVSGTSPFTYQWKKNGVNISGATSSSYTTPPAVTGDNNAKFTVAVSNAFGNITSSQANLTVTANQAPVATISTPSVSARFRGGQAISFSGTGTDAEDGTLAASRFTWQVDYITSINSGNPVIRPFLAAASGSKTGSFTPATITPYTQTDVAYRITLTVEDSAGRTHTATRDVLPQTSTVTLASNVPGLQLTIDGQPSASNFSFGTVVGLSRPIGAPSTQTLNGKTYEFASWSDGGAATHNVSMPASNTTYTATFREVPAGANATLRAVADAYVFDGAKTTNYGSATELFIKKSSAGYVRESFLKFDLRSLGAVSTAKLRLYGKLSQAAAGVTTAVYAATDTSWTEGALNWNNRPAAGATALASQLVTSSTGAWHEFDVSSYLRQQKQNGASFVTFVLKNTTGNSSFTAFNSDESAANRPELVVGQTGTPAATRFVSTGDAYVRDGTPTVNYGGDTEIFLKKAGATYNREAFLKFDLSAIASPSSLGSIKLRLYGHISDNRASNIPTEVRAVSNTTWSETGITWNNKPAIGAQLAVTTITDDQFRWYEWDITSYVKAELAAGRKVISLALRNTVTSTPFTAFNTREAASNRPEIVVA